MIEANELRIGSWIDQEGYVQLDEKFLTVFFSSFSYKELFPIPLTPQMLVKCGFKKQGDYGVLHHNPKIGIRFYAFNTERCDIIQDDKFISLTNSQVKYLHQLQNLHFALTGTELEINDLAG